MVDILPKFITSEENDVLVHLPDADKVKQAVFALNMESAAGPNEFREMFFQKYWDILAEDVTRVVIRVFFRWRRITKVCNPPNLVLLPKNKKVVKTFVDLRPCSLSCFINKVISRVLHERLTVVLPKIISPNQSGFVKGGSIIENFLLAQKIIGDINKRNKHTNIVVKLDMAKTYDRVSWVFLIKVLRKFDFYEIIIDMVWRLVSNKWYSILINGQLHG